MKELLSTLKLNVLTASRTKVKNEWRDPYFHADPFSRLYYISQGDCLILIRDRELSLRKHHVYLLPSGVPLKLRPPKTTFEHYWLHFTATILTGMTLFDLIECPLALPADRFDSPSRHMKKLVELNPESDDTDAGRQLEMNGILSVLLGPFVSAATHKSDSRHKRFDDFDRFESVIKYIESHLHQQIELSSLAKLVNLHPTYFSNLFKSRFGVAPRHYICQRRVTRAQLMLLNSTRTVKEIALEIGYDDEFYFSRLFSRYTGISPTLYRSQRQVRTY